MKQELLKSYLLRDKGFLKELYTGPNPLKNNRILINASDSQLNTLIFYLHFLAKGEIKISKQNFDVVQKLKKVTVLKKSVETKKNTLVLINSQRVDKLSFLKKLNTVYSNLLYGLFHLN